MTESELLELFSRVQAGSLEPLAAVRAMANEGRMTLPVENYASVDLGRLTRVGHSEVIFGESKSAEQIASIAKALLDSGQRALATRIEDSKAVDVLKLEPRLSYLSRARLLVSPSMSEKVIDFRIAVVAAGTSDFAVAEEAACVAEFYGSRVERIYDVGVAGIHRLFARLEDITQADVVIVVAGMEGALPSVVGGLIRAPLIAVPTSVGYGTALGGFTALFGMLTGCSSGTTVVNIDNGFGAAIFALKVRETLRLRLERESQ